VQVPGVIGEDEGTATTTLSGAGLSVVVQDQPVGSEDTDGQVLDQHPRAGRSVRRGASVTITVGRFSASPGGGPGPSPPSG
jgi:eukaryotic-like serine/threonine-protein kinase